MESLRSLAGKKRGSIAFLAIREGLFSMIPLLLLGSFSLVFANFPVPAYQAWLASFAGGRLLLLIRGLYQATFGYLAFIMVLTVSYAYGRECTGGETAVFYPLVSLSGFIAFVYPSQSASVFGPEWCFTALCITLVSCWLFRTSMCWIAKIRYLHTSGTDPLFNLMIRAMAPAILIVSAFAVLGNLLLNLGGADQVLNFGGVAFSGLFERLGNNLPSALLYVLLSHALWFVGVHGTNSLEMVSRNFFEQGVTDNQTLVSMGIAPAQIFSKTFLDTFVFLGGCGAACCFVLALLLAARQKRNRRLAKFGAFPALFNISEFLVFGFPIILNPYIIVPFILTPLVLTLISSAAMALGLVPLVTHSVEWTVPIFFSGYTATGSWAGVVLQAVNLGVGTLIYIPFIRWGEKKENMRVLENIRSLEENMRSREQIIWTQNLVWNSAADRRTAKILSGDLYHAMQEEELELYFQPQVEADGTCCETEALLRWNYLNREFIFPPLMIALAEQAGFLNELGDYVLRRACRGLREMEAQLGTDLSVAVNILPLQLESGNFVPALKQILGECGVPGEKLVLEFTEQIALHLSPRVEARIQEIKDLGIRVSMDDFGMGHGSVLQLQETLFDEVKLDGSLTEQVVGNSRVREIIGGIVQLSQRLGIQVIAERVETEAERDRLAELGCTRYQGYLYGRPMPLAAFCGWYRRRGEGERTEKA